MSFLDMARQRIAMAVKANESAPEPDDAELKLRKGVAMVLESLDKADEKVVQELMTVLLDQLERRFGGKQPAEQQPATNTQHVPRTPDLESYFTEPTRKTDARTPDIDNYFE